MPALKKLQLLRLFIACPGDVTPEKKRILKIADGLQPVARSAGYVLEVKEWRQTVPNMGRPQQVILDQIPAETWDIFIGILWLRFGQPSGGKDAGGKKDESGTYEEFRLAYQLWKQFQRPRILFYQCRRPPADPYSLNEDQFAKVKAFFKEFEVGGTHEGLVKPYRDIEEFADSLREHLQELLLQRVSSSRSKRRERKSVNDSAIDFALYRAAIQAKFRNLKLETLSADQAQYVDVELRSVFVAQDIRNCQRWLPEKLVGPKTVKDNPDSADTLKLADVRHIEEFKAQQARSVFAVTRSVENRLTTILGDPGAGKSSLLYIELLEWAASENKAREIPFLIELRQYHREAPDADFIDFLATNAAVPFNPPASALRAGLQAGTATLLFDGLDEVFDPVHRERVAQRIVKLAQTYPKARIILTSRLIGYPPRILRDAGFEHWVLQDFDDKQLQAFLTRWCSLAVREESDRELVRSRVQSVAVVPSVKELSGNPLLLTMMCMLARQTDLPRDQISLYQECSKLLLELWDANKVLARDEAIADIRLDWRDKHDLLCRLAWHMQNSQAGLRGNLVSRASLEQQFSETFSYISNDSRRRRVIEIVIDQLRERNFILCHLGAEFYAFVHRGFLEYFCAEEIRRLAASGNKPPAEIATEIFQRHCAKDAWKEVLILAATNLPPNVANVVLAATLRTGKTRTAAAGIALRALRLSRNKTSLTETVAALRPVIEQQSCKFPKSAFGADLEAMETLSTLAEFWPGPRTIGILRRIARDGVGHVSGWMALHHLLNLAPNKSVWQLAKPFLAEWTGFYSTPVVRKLMDLFGTRSDFKRVMDQFRKTKHGLELIRAAKGLNKRQMERLEITFGARNATERPLSRSASRGKLRQAKRAPSPAVRSRRKVARNRTAGSAH